MIEVQNVSKRYGSVRALEGVSLRVDQGSVLGLLGQNGAGKTTLLNILTGYLAPTSGRALIDGYDPLLSPVEAKQRLGYMPEHPPLYDEMTVWEYLRFVSALRGVRRDGISAHVEEIMERTGLTDMRTRMLGHLSKGYRQRAGLAQALCGDPEVLILDEPTSGLDPKQIAEIRGLIHDLAADHTIVFSSHILTEVEQLCDHVVILSHGKVKRNMPLGGDFDRRETVLLCTIRAEEHELMSALQGLPGLLKSEKRPGSAPGEVSLALTFGKNAKAEEALFALLTGLGLPLLRLTRQEDSLEKIFLRSICE
ncbi:MAG: ABC transporter ATP-binding protein [Clostridiales bacterium]|nr:ABC transporter ATP-binding protein [Clostridiales bacterium]